jgi:hypothetical protein
MTKPIISLEFAWHGFKAETVHIFTTEKAIIGGRLSVETEPYIDQYGYAKLKVVRLVVRNPYVAKTKPVTDGKTKSVKEMDENYLWSKVTHKY